MKRWTLLLGLLIVGVPTMALAQEDHEDMGHDEMARDMATEHAKLSEEARPEIEARAIEWEDAANSGDFAAVAALYTEDAVAMPPGSPAVEGRPAIQEMMAAGFGGFENLSMDLQTTEVFAVHGAALEIGTYTMEADGAHIDHGKYMAVWKQTDEGWLIARDIWNSDMSPGQ